MDLIDLHIALTKKLRLDNPEAEKVSCVYKITGPTGKLYIGKTVVPLKVRLATHTCAKGRYSTHLTRALRKYGCNVFTIESVLIGFESYCLDMESKLISSYDTIRPRGYNICEGGKGFTSKHKRRWYKTPEGRAHAAYMANVNAGSAGCIKHRVLEELKKDPHPIASMMCALNLKREQVEGAINSLRLDGKHIISEVYGGTFRLIQ